MNTKTVNTSFLHLAAVHLLAAFGEDVKRATPCNNPQDFLTLTLEVLQAHGVTLPEQGKNGKRSTRK